MSVFFIRREVWDIEIRRANSVGTQEMPRAHQRERPREESACTHPDLKLPASELRKQDCGLAAWYVVLCHHSPSRLPPGTLLRKPCVSTRKPLTQPALPWRTRRKWQNRHSVSGQTMRWGCREDRGRKGRQRWATGRSHCHPMHQA